MICKTVLKNMVRPMLAFMVKETIQYYLQNGSMCSTVLDATKAFDRIDFVNYSER